MTEVLIVGANGFLGRALTKKCLERGWITDVAINNNGNNLPEGLRSIYAADKLESLPKTYQYVFNIAAFIPYGAYNIPNERLIESNVNLPLRVHKAFINSKIVYASSISVYGNANGVINEKTECVSPTLYGLSKWSGELVTAHHPSYAIVRFSSLYGKGMTPGTFIPRVINDARTKGVVTLLGTGERLQNYLHIDDAAEYCIHAALNGDNDVYLGINTKAYSNKEVADIVAAETGCQIAHTGSDNSPSFLYTNQHTLDSLKFTPGVPLEEGIKDLIDA